MVVVNKKKGESKDAMFRKFSKMFVEEDVVNEVRKRLFYKKGYSLLDAEEILKGSGIEIILVQES